MLKKAILLSLTVFTLLSVSGQSTPSRPRLVVNIVVGAMRSGDIERYRSSFGDGGFVRLMDGGVNYTNANYNFQQTTTPVSLATLTTGALPTSHGVIGEGWWEYILGDRVELIEDSKVRNLDYNLRDYGYSAHRLIAPTLTERLLSESPKSKSVSISLNPLPSIVMGGIEGTPYWVDPLTCEWGSSTAFMEELPKWVVTYNKSPEIGIIANVRWTSKLHQSFYHNTFYTVLQPKSATRKYEAGEIAKGKSRTLRQQIIYEQLAYTPAGNSAIFDFAKEAIEKLALGGDEHPDILNIYLDPSKSIAQRYGAQSVEVEDMYCHLDSEIGDFLSYITRSIKSGDLLVTLTSDHGISPTYGEAEEPKGRFNAQQFVVLVNSFLKARYGGDNWVLGYEDRNLYIDHKLIFAYKLSISEVQNEVATFALQFRGVAHALTATAMRSGYFGSGYGHKMQNSFYPRRSGDVIINLMPGWIEERQGVRADAGSIYRYDSHVPLVIYGEGYFLGQSVGREVSMECLTPTLSRILNIPAPAAAEGEPLDEIVGL